jgi:vancomycin permeability regulator SanA
VPRRASLPGVQDPTRPVVVIMGAAVRPGGVPSPALRDRVAAALAWGEAQPVPPLYLPTGGVGVNPPAESEVMARLLRAAGVDPARILQEPTATDTLSSVLACVALLRGHAGVLRVATHRFHLPRTLLLFRLAGRPARGLPPGELPGRAGLHRWRSRLREVPALPYDAALMAWWRLTARRRR